MLEVVGADLRLDWVEIAKIRQLACCAPFQNEGVPVAICIKLVTAEIAHHNLQLSINSC